MQIIKHKCHLGLWHQNECVYDLSNEIWLPNDNNGWIYTAIAEQYGLPIDRTQLEDTYQDCLKDGNNDQVWHMWRLPNKRLPPISRDELIGMASLKIPLLVRHLEYYEWYTCRYRYRYGPIISWTNLKALWHSRKNRNYIWENEIFEAYKILFKIRAADRYYIKKQYNKQVSMWETVSFHISALITAKFGKDWEKNVLSLQAYHLDSKFIMKIIGDAKKNILSDFGENHPITRSVYGQP